MNPKDKIEWRAKGPWISFLSTPRKRNISKQLLRRSMQALGMLLLSIFVISCATPPKYVVYPTLSMKERLEGPGREKTNRFHYWTKQMDSELSAMASNEWVPSSQLLTVNYPKAAREYGESQNMTDFTEVQNAFYEKFRLEDDPKGHGVAKNIMGMLQFIDHEHPNILVDASSLKPLPKLDNYRLPSMVSSDYPVGVSLTRWTTPSPPESKDSGSTLAIAGNAVVLPSKQPLICVAEGNTLKCKQEDAKKDANEKEKAEKPQAKSGDGEDFKSAQAVTLSLSTVLNSPVVLDRIEYVSTYLYLVSFPFPPNGGVVLEKEFWNRYLALNSARDSVLKEKAIKNDLRRAVEDMRVRIIDVETTVKQSLVDLGSLQRKTSDKFSADIEGKVAVSPNVTDLTPKLGYSTEVNTEANLKLQQQLDQRSTYVDPSGHFFRITQRGMQSVNLAGRFVENLKLFVPASQDQLSVLVPGQHKEGETSIYGVKWISQPLYSRVDALTLSVVVARQATALAKSTKDSFRLDDAKDAAFIVGLTRPYRFTLWQHERDLWQVMTTEIFGEETGKRDNQKVYFTIFEKDRPAPLILSGFTPEQRQELFGKIREKSKSSQDGIVSLCMGKGNKRISIGLPDDTINPTRLRGFEIK